MASQTKKETEQLTLAQAFYETPKTTSAPVQPNEGLLFFYPSPDISQKEKEEKDAYNDELRAFIIEKYQLLIDQLTLLREQFLTELELLEAVYQQKNVLLEAQLSSIVDDSPEKTEIQTEIQEIQTKLNEINKQKNQCKRCLDNERKENEQINQQVQDAQKKIRELLNDHRKFVREEKAYQKALSKQEKDSPIYRETWSLFTSAHKSKERTAKDFKRAEGDLTCMLFVRIDGSSDGFIPPLSQFITEIQKDLKEQKKLVKQAKDDVKQTFAKANIDSRFFEDFEALNVRYEQLKIRSLRYEESFKGNQTRSATVDRHIPKIEKALASDSYTTVPYQVYKKNLQQEMLAESKVVHLKNKLQSLNERRRRLEGVKARKIPLENHDLTDIDKEERQINAQLLDAQKRLKSLRKKTETERDKYATRYYKNFQTSTVDARIQAVIDYYNQKPSIKDGKTADELSADRIKEANIKKYEIFRTTTEKMRALEKRELQLLRKHELAIVAMADAKSAFERLLGEQHLSPYNDPKAVLTARAKLEACAAQENKLQQDLEKTVKKLEALRDKLAKNEISIAMQSALSKEEINKNIVTKEALIDQLLKKRIDTKRLESREALEKIFKRRTIIRNTLFVFFGIFGAIAGAIYAGAFMTGILAPEATEGFMASTGFKAGYMGLFGMAAIGIEVYCCAIGLPLLVDWLLSSIIPTNYEEYLNKKLSALEYKLVYEYDPEQRITRQVLKKKFKEPWFKWLTRVITAPFLLVGIMASNAFGTMLFVRNNYHKIMMQFGIPPEFAAVLSWIPGCVMAVASLVFNIRRAIDMLPKPEYGEVNKEGTWIDEQTQQKADTYEHLTLSRWLATGFSNLKDAIKWAWQNPKPFLKAAGAVLLAIVLATALAIITIADLKEVIVKGLGLGTVDAVRGTLVSPGGMGLFATLCAAIGITQYLASKGSLDNGFAPHNVKYYNHKTGEYIIPGHDRKVAYRVALMADHERMPFDKIGAFFGKILDWRFRNNWWSARELFNKTGQWLTADKAVAHMIGVGVPAMTKAIVAGSILGFTTGTGPIAIAVVAAIILAFGAAYFVLYNFDTRGDRTLEGALSAFCNGMNAPFAGLTWISDKIKAGAISALSYIRNVGKKPETDKAVLLTSQSSVGVPPADLPSADLPSAPPVAVASPGAPGTPTTGTPTGTPSTIEEAQLNMRRSRSSSGTSSSSKHTS